MTTRSMIGLLVAFFGLYLGLATPAAGKGAACLSDAVQVGPVCVDKYEASVWDLSGIPTGKAKTKLISSIQSGKATEAALLAAGAVQRGVASDDYPCNDDGNDCTTIFAVSIPGVTPSNLITWFQAAAAARNSGKRLLTNAEWQMAAAGTPDPGTDNGTTDCNVFSTFAVVDTGSRTGCKSRFGVFDMVGNLHEWVEDWVPHSTVCVTALFAGDANCLAGASTTSGPGALIRGGFFVDAASAGVFAVNGDIRPSGVDSGIGFRCGR